MPGWGRWGSRVKGRSLSSSQPGEKLCFAWRPTCWPGLLWGILSTKYSGVNEADKREKAVSRNRGSEIKKANKGGRREHGRKKLVKQENNRTEKVLKTGNLLSPK